MNDINTHRGNSNNNRNMNGNGSNGSTNGGGGNNARQQQKQQGGNESLGLGARISQNIEAARKGYEQLVHAIIRPPRAKYKLTDTSIGPKHFIFLNQQFIRKDITLPTHRNLSMKVSIWHRVENKKKDSTEETTTTPTPTTTPKTTSSSKTMVVYLHGNASCRLEVLPQLSFLLAQGIYGVVSLDFTGSGQSDGQYVSLGYYERFDLQHLLEYLHEEYGNNGNNGNGNNEGNGDLQVVLWGRSMGASTALMHASQITQEQAAKKLSGFKSGYSRSNSRASSAVSASSSNGGGAGGGDRDEKDNNSSKHSSTSDGSNSSSNATDAIDPRSQSLLDIVEDEANVKITNSITTNDVLLVAQQQARDDEISSTESFSTVSMIKGLICDSPFCSLKQLCGELVEKAREQGIVVPGIVVTAAIALIDRSVQNLAKFSVHDITPIEHVSTINVPALFVVGADDDFIPCHHSEDLVEYYQKGIRTNLFMVPGGHNDPRPEVVFEAVKQFLRNCFNEGESDALLTEDMALPVEKFNIQNTYYKNPPWAYRRYPTIFQEVFDESDSDDDDEDEFAGDDSDAKKPMKKNNGGSVEEGKDGEGEQQQEELGMTKERQDDIQNKVNQMFGGGGQQQQQETTSATTAN